MVKKFITVLFSSFFLLFIFIRIELPVQGQESATNTQSAQIWRCLSAAQVGGQSKKPPEEVDLSVSGAGFVPDQEVHIVVCQPDYSFHGTQPQNYKCSTGNPDTDRLLFGTDRTGSIRPVTLEVPSGTSPPQTVRAVGDKLQFVMHVTNAIGHRSYAFFGATVVEPKVIPGQASTLQYGTFEFQQDPQAVGGCKSIRWDPYGRVFDSQSLEPIPNVSVTLLDQDKAFYSQIGLTNPEITEADGVYNFFVDIEGTDPKTFFLNPVKAGYTFSANPNMHPNFNKAYYDIYKPDEAIVEYPGQPEHRDIPLDPGSNPPFRGNPVSVTSASVRLGRYIRYEGTVSHPLSIIRLLGKNSGTEIVSTEADKTGFWSILVPHEKIPQDESLIMVIEKVDITTLSKKRGGEPALSSVYNFVSRVLERILSLANKEVSAQSDTKGDEFSPILSYVEGFAKDSSGNAMPNATVNVRIQMSDGLYYQTTTDENGFFTVPPERLPIFNYYLEVVKPGASVGTKMSTTDFVKENEDHLANNNINLMAATKNGESLLPPPPSTPESESEANTVPDQEAKTPLFAGSNMNLILTVVALIVLLGVTGGVLMYIKKKKSETDDLL